MLVRFRGLKLRAQKTPNNFRRQSATISDPLSTHSLHLEIERRFLCRIADPRVLRGAARRHVIRQGYLTDAEPAVRIRSLDGEYILTIKSGRGRIRREVEVKVDADVGEALMAMAAEHRLEKERYVLGAWEVDVFRGKLEGLVLAEIELEDAESPLPPPPDGITLGHEVTDDGAYTNQRLAALGEAEARRWVVEAPPTDGVDGAR